MRERNASVFWSGNDVARTNFEPQAGPTTVPDIKVPGNESVASENGSPTARPPKSRGESDGPSQPQQLMTEFSTLERASTAISPRRVPLRPSQRRWQTELGRTSSETNQAARPPSPPKRSGTSYLSTAIWQRCDDEYASSSSSDEDEDVIPAPGNLRRTQTQIDNELKSHLLKHRSHSDVEEKENTPSLMMMQTQRTAIVDFFVNETAGTGYIAKALGSIVNKAPPTGTTRNERPSSHRLSSDSTFASADLSPKPRLNIVIMVIGSRGDVQPFLKIGRILKEDYGHRVRIATHPTFRDYVQRDSGLEFFSVGGDPSELMAFMVKNPGLIPTLETVRAGDIGKRRAAMAEMFDGFWRACINATDDEKDYQNLKMMGAKDPFVADAIIANPPSFAHIHCAEALGIPVHLMFTFPYSPTQAFPHPLVSIKRSNIDPGYTNFISYPLVEMMVWQGLGDLVNDFRVKTLALDPVSTLWAPGETGLGDHINISGFVYLDLASSFTPPPDLEEFLNSGETPIYIGFGSIVVDDAERFTELIFEAVEKAGVRALVSRGWGGLGSARVPKNIFMLDNTPHDWLFPKVKACVIHGGAGTTAIALKCGLPTMVVPFFGDQIFWGSMVARSGVGPQPIPYRHLTAENLSQGIRYLQTDEAREAAREIANGIEREGDGAKNAVRAFHNRLNLQGRNTMRCSVLKDRIAVWQLKNTPIKLSPLAADILVDAGHLSWKKLRLVRHVEWNDFEGPGEPVTGVAGSLVGSARNAFRGVAGVPFHLARRTKRRKKMREERRANPKSKGNLPDSSRTEDLAIGNVEDSPRGVASVDLLRAEELARTPATELHAAYFGDVREGVGITASAIARAPVDLSVALAQGFHNAPRLYGDDTVRKPVRITGIRSGLRAAKKEFLYGIYDGFTGVVLLPIRGAKKNGVIGFVKGTSMGLTGFVLKNLAAIVGPFSYTLKGLVKQAERKKRPTHFIRRARITQGQREFYSLAPDKRQKLEQEVIEGCHVMRELSDAISRHAQRRGLAGQIDKVFLDTSTLFEDVETAKGALRALKKGERLENILGPDGMKTTWCRRDVEERRRTRAQAITHAGYTEVEERESNESIKS
uniref:Glycosyltransferase family 28 N-terminal domain-containing protein n=1 Tax=Bionectria ochroleuca TaxID=29856 RepID=A0A8H7K977_BIOOC